MRNIAVIIVNWNGKKDTLECLTSLKLLKSGDYHIDIIVVDNASTDGSVAEIRNKYKDVDIVVNNQNLGFSGGNNIGIDRALQKNCDFIWFLNNDTYVANDSLIPLISTFDRLQAGIVGSKIYFAPGREYHNKRYSTHERGKVLWYAGGIIDWDNMYASHRGVDEVDTGQYDRVEVTGYVSGCSMLISRNVLEKIGAYDDRFFMYLEDLDLCLRARKNNFDIYYVPQSRVWHKNAGSTARPGNELHQYYITRNRLLIGFRYAPLRTRIALLRESLRLLIRGNSIQKKAISDAFMCRFGNQFIWKK